MSDLERKRAVAAARAKSSQSKQETPRPAPEDVSSDRKRIIPEDWQGQPVGGSFGEKMYGLGESATGFGSSVVAEPIAGITGLYEMGRSFFSGGDDPVSSAAGAIEHMRDALTYRPKTEQGKAILQNMTQSPRLEGLMEKARTAGEKTLGTTGSPAAATAVQTGIEALPSILGGEAKFGIRPSKSAPKEGARLSPGGGKEKPSQRVTQKPTTRKATQEDLNTVLEVMDREGIDTTSRESFLKSVEDVGQRIQEDPGFAGSMESLRNAVIGKRKREKEQEARLWDEAREGKEGYVRKIDLKEYRKQLDEALDGFVLEDMPKARRLLKRFDASLKDMPDSASGRVSELMRWRKAINRNLPGKDQDPAQRAVMDSMRNNLDNFLENKFATDMIKGDPQSVKRWQAAIQKSDDIHQLFDGDKIIKSFARNDVTAEELRGFIFNSSEAGAKATAANTVRKLKEIVGEDSKQFKQLKFESMFNLVEPLMGDIPDFKKFSQNYRKFIKKNPSLAKELFDEEDMKAFEIFNSSAKAAESRQKVSDKLKRDVREGVVRHLVGHGIAQAGSRVRIASDVMDKALNAKTSSAQRDVIRDYLGYDPTKSVFRGPIERTGGAMGGIQASEEAREEQQE